MGFVHETDLYGSVFFETAPNSGTTTWTDHTATVQRMSLTRGGGARALGVSDVQAGVGTITLVDNTATINVGYWVRVRTASGNVWAGYVQDILTNLEIVNGQTYTIKTLVCLDWVGYAGQIIFQGLTGLQSNGAAITSVPYDGDKRIHAINYGIDATGATALVSYSVAGRNTVGHTDETLSLAQHLDLLANSNMGVWNSTTATPTNATTGRDGLLSYDNNAFVPTVNVAFTDGTHTGTPTNPLYYQNAVKGSRTSAVANTVIVRNRAQLSLGTSDVANDPARYYSHEHKVENTSSITSYGSRQLDVTTNCALVTAYPTFISSSSEPRNRIKNPNFELGGEGWQLGDYANSRYAVRQPLLDATPFAAKSGTWAMRDRVLAATNSQNISYLADDRDGIPVVAGQKYGVSFWGARTTSRSGFIYIDVRWYDTDNALVSTTTGATQVTMTNAATWYQVRQQFTAPANAVTAKPRFYWQRTTGLQWQVGDKLWIDNACFWRMENAADWYENDGFYSADYESISFSTGTVGASESVTVNNQLEGIGYAIAIANGTPRDLPQFITWNAQQDLSKVHLIDINKTVYIWLQGVKTWQPVVGIRHEITRGKWITEVELAPMRYVLP